MYGFQSVQTAEGVVSGFKIIYVDLALKAEKDQAEDALTAAKAETIKAEQALDDAKADEQKEYDVVYADQKVRTEAEAPEREKEEQEKA